MTEWYVIDRRTNEIINCITTDGPRMPSVERFTEAEFLYLDPHPPMHMLQRYRYWNERP
jgi:hypothetical protein